MVLQNNTYELYRAFSIQIVIHGGLVICNILLLKSNDPNTATRSSNILLRMNYLTPVTSHAYYKHIGQCNLIQTYGVVNIAKYCEPVYKKSYK